MGKGFLYGNGGGSSKNKSQIIVTVDAGSTVTCSNGTVTKTATATNGTCTFTGLDVGTWTISATLNGQTAASTVTITEADQKYRYYVTITYNTIPAFTYTGDYEIVDDEDNPITVSSGNWKIRFLTSGTLTFSDLNGADGGIDVFLVGGGESGGVGGSIYGGGGGSGRTKTLRGLSIVRGQIYDVTVGAGGIPGSNSTGNPGGTTSFDSHSVQGGGSRGSANSGGPGGSGGRGGGGTSIPASNTRAQDGADGINGSGYTGGKGQGTTTREFGEPDGKLYAYGGILTNNPVDGEANTGNGGDGTYKNQTSLTSSGGSGIVIIRNAREVE